MEEKTIVIGGKKFAVTSESAADGPRYILKRISKHGLMYGTMRTKRRPHLMFLINGNRRGPDAVTNIWVSDEGGELRVLGG